MTLYLRGSTWWTYIVVNGRRIRKSLKTADQNIAIQRAGVVRERVSEPFAKDGWFPRTAALRMVSRARGRALKRGIECSVTEETILNIAKRSGGRCEVSFIPFNMNKGNHRIGPFSPSLDRIDPKGPYIESNVRLVASCVNLAMQSWGPRVIEAIAKGYLAKNRATNTPQFKPIKVA